MKIWTSEHVFEHPWNTVVHAAWRKYPNPINPAVTGIDVLDRKVGSDGVLRTNRLIKTEWSIPGWATRLIGLDNPSYAYEYSEVDIERKTMMLKSLNLNCTRFVSVDERLVYKPHPDDPEKTLLEQSSTITVRGVPLIDYLESLVVSNMEANTHKGRDAMEWVIGNIKREYEEISQKLSSEYQELSQKLSTEYGELSHSVRQGMDELRRGIDDLSHIAENPNSTTTGS